MSKTAFSVHLIDVLTWMSTLRRKDCEDYCSLHPVLGYVRTRRRDNLSLTCRRVLWWQWSRGILSTGERVCSIPYANLPFAFWVWQLYLYVAVVATGWGLFRVSWCDRAWSMIVYSFQCWLVIGSICVVSCRLKFLMCPLELTSSLISIYVQWYVWIFLRDEILKSFGAFDIFYYFG